MKYLASQDTAKHWKNWLFIALFMTQKNLVKMLYGLDQNQCFLKMLMFRIFFQLSPLRSEPRCTSVSKITRYDNS
ncbi:MAG: hypothetical protein AUK21_02785 [Parcubacteria group bacterium CG2_30_48_51]|nr:MAG: hypothetical protein AUK21_02785 [Parcubacteria group bacterium CG2_30_48_51]